MPSTKDFGREIMNSKSGTWFEILEPDHAELAGEATQTAIGMFFNSFAKKAPHRWFYLVEDIHTEHPKSPVCLAAVPREMVDQDSVSNHRQGLAPCHVTGFRNRNAYYDYSDDLEALAKATGIHMAPNFMGRPTRAKTEMDTHIQDVYALLNVGPEELAEFVPEGLTLEMHNWDAMRAIRVLDGDTPIAFLLDEDEEHIYSVGVPEKGLELATLKLGQHPRAFFEKLEEEATRIELSRDTGPSM